jgi:hypothetical protein
MKSLKREVVDEVENVGLVVKVVVVVLIVVRMSLMRERS